MTVHSPIPGRFTNQGEPIEEWASVVSTPPTEFKKASLSDKALILEYVDPTSPAWSGFVEKLRSLPDGSKIQTKDGFTLTKDGNTFGDDEVMFLLDDFDGAAKELLPPVAIRQAGDQSFLGQQREDGSWSVQNVDPLKAEALAEKITDAPDGNKAKAFRAPNADEAAGQLHENMKKDHITPVEPPGPIRPIAHVLKAGNLYIRVDSVTATGKLVDKQCLATKFTSKRAAIVWKASDVVAQLVPESDVHVISLKQRCR